ncbi:siderophore iron transporter mirb [Diaporthe amygdali]|uniref:siderophore iron transporter mirb n=1 Tax=Phomopsis amygdali TaxID=1214568 RepID=UPI0022FE708D|nr:siderophore iron transporter mirb [Diaporthe amygdali]KAJ0119000.1 siderophore iron transporter mirb [Diaporthe amygdali]
MAAEKTNESGPTTGLADQHVNQGAEKGQIAIDNTSDSGSASDNEHNTGGLAGVERIEATTRAWTKPWLILTYIFIWIIFFTDSLQQQISASLLPFVTSDFGLHGLIATTSIISVIVSGVVKLPLARVLDVIGRNEGFIIMLNIQTYAAGQVFFWTGMNGIGYVLQIFIADTTKLKNRMIMFGFTTTPYISNTFAGPAAAQEILRGTTWRWGFGAFCIIIPAVCAPVITIFAFNLRKAKKLGLVKEKSHSERTRTRWQSAKHWFIELDVFGVLLCVAGFSLLLLPFSLATYQAEKWRSGTVISMLIIGVLCLIAFPLYEKYIAPKTFIPFALFKNRNVLAAALLGGNTWISFYCYKLYFSSYLQVVYNLSVSKAGYIVNIFNIVSCAWAIPVGLLIRYTDRFKWLALISVPLWILFTGLMVKFRMPGTNIAYVVMCEVFTSLAGGTLAQVEQIAAMSAVPHRDVAVSLAIVGLVTSVGGAIGQSISGAIWTNTLPGLLRAYLPEELKEDWATIYGDVTVQLGYEWGSPAREAIVRAYGETQKYMLIASLVSAAGSVVWVTILKNERLSDKQQTKGVLF